MYHVSRQCYYGKELAVEIWTKQHSDDLLPPRYPEELQGYVTPREAIEAAKRVRRRWLSSTDEPIRFAYVYSGNDGGWYRNYFTEARLYEWATQHEKLPKCATCKTHFSKLPVNITSGVDACSLECAEQFMHDAVQAYKAAKVAP